ncbi:MULTISPECIES: aldolase/citrate lyase family protein [Pelosinus]|uniref:HpcH/HpaI aldolase n=1 Tax=Pelosinus fermentans B4 TaxID=1149862 RepID=I9LFY9_9FIRM|nr:MULTISPECIES: aldolase/citrate lyase family protein [Pelosinus]EIW19286.1 HpcH/HpaI aldolase [Pelosinus fermentans B4]EIW24983.1 HpcH/HpaI aldolase [Pelosinus fermentans A11]OAM96268.1 Citryl-CoA lyase [Pelosinus fermentans DSM 17108]SDR38236.1 citrate lyase subunit beta / citryl-CoA lyase [Pelosinus fermentans]
MKLRRTMMFVPGNNPGMLINAGIYGADTIIFDLEDSVALSEKDAARHLVYNAMKSIRYSCEVAVRINHISTPFGYKDLETILAVKPDLIRLPKAETAADIEEIDELITAAEIKHGFRPGSINMMAAIETAKGIRNAYDIAAASPRMVAIAIGGEDYLADLQTSRTKDGKEFFAGRGQLILAAREAGIHAIDTVFGDVNNEEDFIAETTRIKEMGFDGKSVVNPRQINIVHEIYAPTEKEIDHAQRVIAAYEESLARKSGVVSLNGKMIDIPVVKRAQRTLAYANAVGKNERGTTL